MSTPSEWKSEAVRLLRNGTTLESTLTGVIREGEFSIEHRENIRSRETTLDLIRKKLMGFKTGLKNIDNRLKSVREQKHGTYDPSDLQRYLESFESKLTSYKSSMRAEFDALRNEEDTLGKDVNNMLERIDDWGKVESSSLSSSSNNSKSKGIDIVNQANVEENKRQQRERTVERYEKHLELQGKIGTIDRQIANLGGMYGGWDSRDHDSFIRSWVQTMSSTSTQTQTQIILSSIQRRTLMKRLIANVPIKTEEELDDHIDWYLKHLDLSVEKKTLLDEWKGVRQKEISRKQKSSLEQYLDEDDDSNDKSNHRSIAKSVFQVEDREAQKIRIANWKKEKAEEERLQTLTDKESKLAEIQRIESEKRKRQSSTRAKLESWKKEEEKCKEVIEKTERMSKISPRVSSAQLADRQARDREMTQIKLARVEKAQDRTVARELKVRELAKALKEDGTVAIPIVKKDTSRLTGLTKTTQMRKEETEGIGAAHIRRTNTSAHSSHMAMHGRDLQGMGRMPASWMK
jgi:hypothetical protein